MTIITAASWAGKTWIGCDQAGTDGWGVQTDFGTKLHRAPFGWLGYTASYRTLQAIHRQLRTVEKAETEDDMEALVDCIDEALKLAGWSRSHAEHLPKCEDLTILVATWSGKLWTIHSDLAFLRHKRFAAIGSGYQVALGSLFSSHVMRRTPLAAVSGALRATCSMIATCSKPARAVEVKK